jgi:hypothetical protein
MTRQLETVFEPRQAHVLSTVISRAYDELVKTSDFNELKEIVRDLGTAQQRTEARMEELAAAQQRTEARMEELAAAQQRTEEEVRLLASSLRETREQLSAEINRLDRGLHDTREQLSAEINRLDRGLRDTRSELGGLSRSVGYALENEAYRALPAFLETHYDLEMTDRLVRAEIAGEEINVFGRARRNGHTVLIVGETKLRLDERRSAGEGAESVLETLARKVAAVQSVYPDETVVPILVTHFARPAFLREAEARGIIVVQSFEW